jgi:DNA-binding cell septation regulator SpoVG
MSNLNIVVEVSPPCRASNSQIASCTIRFQADVGSVVVHDCRILRNKSGIIWFSLPTFSIQSGNRQYEYHPTIELSPDLLQQISTEALRAYTSWRDQLNETKTGASNVQPNSAR